MSDVREWLSRHGLAQVGDVLEREQIDWGALLVLSESDLKDLGLPIGQRAKLLAALRSLRERDSSSAESTVISPERRSVTGPGLEAERRQLTILFCDLVGSTSLSQKVDPEPLRDLMQRYQQACRAVIERYDGHVAQYLGDGLMVYFGWPRAHEDDAERAVRSALELVDAVKKVSATPPLQVRIGIATGAVVVGETGAGDASVPKLAVGETPNLAARLQGLAAPDQIIISPSTQRLLGGTFTYADLGPQLLKGIVEPVRPYRIIEQGKTEGRFEAARGLSLTPLVGRESELALVMERWEQALAGEGQLILIGGEPGIGKSRITQALRNRLQGQSHHRLLRYQCSPYHAQSALYPVVEQIESTAGFAREDTVENKLDKLEALLRPGGQELSLVAPLFGAMLSLPVERYPTLTYSPQKQKEKLLEALVEQIGGLSKSQPVLMVFEDAHWVDPTTHEALDLLVSRIAKWRVTLLITYRPEYSPRWSGEAHVTTLTLNRFNRRLGAQLAERVAQGKSLPPEVVEQILAKTDGVPLFVEELTKTVLESGLLREAGAHYELDGPLPPLAIPSTLHDSLMARLDRLSPVKEVAQIGSCIGREFSYDLLASIATMHQRDLDEALGQLAQSQLVFQHGTPPQSTYTFKHALVQDTAYGSLLISRRQALHKSIAETLKERFPERVVNEPEVVAHHYTEAGLNDMATDYWLLAARRDVERFANVEAIAHLNRGLKAWEALPAGMEKDRRELLLQINLGTALGNSKGYTPPEVGRAFSRARELCERVGDMPKMLSILFGLWVFYVMRADYRASGEIDHQILALAEQVADSGGTVAGHQTSCATQLFAGDFQRSIFHGKSGLSAYDEDSHRDLAMIYGLHPGAMSADFLAWSLLIVGFPDQSKAKHAFAWQVATALHEPLTMATILVHIALLDCLYQDAHATLTKSRQVIALCKESGILIRQAEGEILEGWALSELGDTARGIPQLEAGIAVWHQLGAQIANPVWFSCLARAYAKAGRHADARNALQKAFDATDNNGERFMEPDLYRIEGDFFLAFDDDQTHAATSYRKAIKLAQELNAKFWELRAATALARLWGSQGKREEAFALLLPVYNWFTEGFATEDLKDAKALLSELQS
jgi:class 3 adenylate cyclase/predicted ATPase